MRNLFSVVALALLISACAGDSGSGGGGNKSVDANGACTQDYISAWNDTASKTKYVKDNQSYVSTSTVEDAQSACNSFFANHGGVSCKAHDKRLLIDRQVSSSELQTDCDQMESIKTQIANRYKDATPRTPTYPSVPYPYSSPTPSSGSGFDSDGRCTDDFINEYNSVNSSISLYNLRGENATSFDLADAKTKCENFLKKYGSTSCRAQRLGSSSYSYSYNSYGERVYGSELKTKCDVLSENKSVDDSELAKKNSDKEVRSLWAEKVEFKVLNSKSLNQASLLSTYVIVKGKVKNSYDLTSTEKSTLTRCKVVPSNRAQPVTFTKNTTLKVSSINEIATNHDVYDANFVLENPSASLYCEKSRSLGRVTVADVIDAFKGVLEILAAD